METGINDIILYLAAVLTAGYGACTDLKYHKIYNKLTMPAILTGLVCNLLLKGLEGLTGSLLGILTGALFVPLWILGMLKAGDVKLYIAVGAFVGWRCCGYTMIFSVLIGGVAAFCLMAVRKSGRASLERLKVYMLHLLYTKEFEIYRPEDQSAYFSFGCCIFIGILVAVWYLQFK